MTQEELADLVMQRIEEYGDKFNDQFPTQQLPIMNDHELLGIIERCLKEGKPAQFYFKFEEDVVY